MTDEFKPARLVPAQGQFNWRDHLAVHPAAELFPLMSEAELRELADDIKKHGLREAVAIWDDPEDHYKKYLLDGRNRLDAMELTGDLVIDKDLHPCHRRGLRIDKAHVNVREGGKANLDPYFHVISKNVHRRHLTPEQKRELIASVLKAKPEASNRQIAKQVKADDKTVASVRRDLESTAEIPQLEKTIGADGKARPTIRLAGQTLKSLDGFGEAAKQQIADAIGDAVDAASKEEHQIDSIGDHIECAMRSAETIRSMWSRIERRNPEILNDVRVDVAAEIRALIVEWENALALVAKVAA